MNYFENIDICYKTITRNLINCGIELSKKGYDVYVANDASKDNDSIITTLYIFNKYDHICRVEFNRVPYGWICNSMDSDRLSFGLSKDDKHIIPFDTNYIISKFGPIERFKDHALPKSSFLRFHNWLIRLEEYMKIYNIN